ncbi:hypothetical protein [Paenibacillus sp. CF384]|uniref:hypothetical protein n=1 Tax=Paenibacillus sp. CF384 TaxID=1884382 RepID=UPI000894BE1A|nr:hypothetical protein [Paenibacillus sp. CF384]SDW55928.1 hypothetical protein SAMN05518855_100385 [Paenibacillus sp. CF384]
MTRTITSLTTKQIAYAAAACTMLLLLSSCSLGVTGIETTDKGRLTAEQSGSHTDDHSDSPQKAYVSKGEGQETLFEETPSQDATIADAQTESSTGKAGTKQAAVKEEPKWDPKAPKLHGISIGDAKTVLDLRLGKQTDSYMIKDEKETITVIEYPGFSIGYGSDKKVRFVEVFEKNVSSSLSGLRVGDSESAVTTALGKPTTHTASVLAYQATGALLKLDLDPETKKVLSMKLFILPDKP